MLAKLFQTKLIVDVVIVIFGLYMLFISVRMKLSGKINPIFLAEEDLKKCKNKEPFAKYMSVRSLVFSIIILICGICGCVCECMSVLPYMKYIELAVFLLAFFNFIRQIRNAKDMFVGFL